MSEWTWEELRGDNATVDLTYTYHMGKYSCVAAFYFIHIRLNQVIYYGGMLCFLSRLVPQLKWTHAFLGRVYITAMCLSTAAAMLIHNTGLALGVLVLFIWVLSGMILGWFLIKQHQNQMNNRALELVDQWLKEDKLGGRSLLVAVAEAKNQISMAKTWVQRFISYKAAHGILMTLSWFNIAGRFWASAIDTEFTCYTYPYYKKVNAPIYRTKDLNNGDKSLAERQVPIDDPNKAPLGSTFPFQEWGWMAMLFIIPVVSAILIGIGFSVWAAKRERASLQDEQDERSVQLVDAAVGS